MSLAAIRHVVLRYGGFYGPGTAIGLAPEAAAAVDHGQPGIYNVVDDERAGCQATEAHTPLAGAAGGR
jgi:hypothetical protein